MPSFKLSNALRRDPSRPSLKARAAALKAQAARVIGGRPDAVEPEDHSDFGRRGLAGDLHMMAGAIIDDDGRAHFCDAAGKVHHKPVADWIGFMAQRLYAQARTEMARQLCDPALDDAARSALRDRLQRDLRLDALDILWSRSGEAFDAAREAGEDLPAVRVQRPSYAGAVSSDLIRAVEAHREARQLFLLDPVEDDARDAANDARVTMLGDAVRNHEAQSLADLRYKLLYLGRDLAEAVNGAEARGDLASIERDVLRLADVLAPHAQLDLSACTAAQLARLYESVEGVWMHLSGASCAPCFMGQGREAYTPAGLVLDAEYNRYADLLEAIRDEARSRPATTEGANERLLILTRHALICDDHLPPALTAEVARAWSVEA